MQNVTHVPDYTWQSPRCALMTLAIPLDKLALLWQVPYWDYIEPGLGREFSTFIRLESGDVLLMDELIEQREQEEFSGTIFWVESNLIAASMITELIKRIMQELELDERLIKWRQSDEISAEIAKDLVQQAQYKPPEPVALSDEEAAKQAELAEGWGHMYDSLPKPVLVYPPKEF